MKSVMRSLRSPLGRVRGLGSAHAGTEHWIGQRLTSLALIPLSLYPVVTFFLAANHGGYGALRDWLHSPISATAVILFLLVGFHHAANGLQVVIEDYVHCECAKSATLFVIKFGSLALALAGTLATLKIMLGA
ncbi:MAG: succinate dehydrogenase, hydrophobic membrane anchor protein [Alphaproteobacteria bacterium]|nr:succinate dehydrogenase, hydrophobic membrane anchor protein [Alphaproteobacteria bacterium]